MRRASLAIVSAVALAGCGGSAWDESWENAESEEIDEAIVSSGRCEPDDEAVLLHLGWPPGTPQPRGPARQYVRDPSGSLITGSGPLDLDATLPRSAHFSGYRRGDAELWLAAYADEFVYLVFDDHVERWPRMTDPIGCA